MKIAVTIDFVIFNISRSFLAFSAIPMKAGCESGVLIIFQRENQNKCEIICLSPII